MKCTILFFSVTLFAFFTTSAQSISGTQNIFIVTIDGVRWQEIFKGADSVIIKNSRYTSDVELSKLLYLDSSAVLSRKKLLPFFWNVLDKSGQLYGNRLYKNKVNVSNAYKFSYPGYNELFTGYPDLYVSSNGKNDNLNINVLEYLNSFEEFKNKVIAFTSWNIFPYILNSHRSLLPVYSGYDSIPGGNINNVIFNKIQQNVITEKGDTRADMLTFIAASEYIKANKPRVVLISFGECDEDAHNGKYDQYLQHLNEDDKMIQQLWYYIQSTSEYKNKTTLIITTDHGRGRKSSKWTSHDALNKGSGDAWLAVIGPDTKPLGEIQLPQQLYQKQVASTIARFLGYNFTANHPVANAIDFRNMQ
jgi:hypothetical protein